MNYLRRAFPFLAVIFSALFLTACATSNSFPGKSSGYVPTPQMAIQFGGAMTNDTRKWTVQNLVGNKNQILAELVPAGDSLKSWKEMAAQQIAFTTQPLRAYVDTWKQGLTSAEANPAVKESPLENGSILLEYQAPKANELGIRKFMQGPDGIYMMAYHVRPTVRKDDTYQLWHSVVAQSKLIPNPERRR